MTSFTIFGFVGNHSIPSIDLCGLIKKMISGVCAKGQVLFAEAEELEPDVFKAVNR